MQRTKKTINTKVIPAIERLVKWLVRKAFELIQLAALSWAVMSLIDATPVLEYAVTSIVVFAAFYFTRIWK